MNVKRLTAGMMASLVAVFGLTVGALADGVKGIAHDGGVWLQTPMNEQAAKIDDFHMLLLWIITIIAVFVFLLVFWVMYRYREKKNPEPSKTSHNTLIEFIWTVVPIGILVFIGFWSIPLLYYQDVVPDTEFAIRVTGNQWNWTYNYPDQGGIEFTASVVPNSAFKDPKEMAGYESELSKFLGHPVKIQNRLLDPDYRLVVPVHTKIRLQITGSDVIHSWAVPSLGVKLDAIPGRLNQTWFEADDIGTFYGQCSELCGQDHAFMPIAVEVVSKEDFAKWVKHAKAEYADAGTTALGR